ncbi:MAG: MaoC family dehydratase N-terminal domain-containing protein [Gammaproteobacteria bacterium]|nr:MaoC family dehydratase N-terminal domain-containing protein [Gammaproteobacteria bacterium]MBI5618708.1 MaoC family dehydratase N-terminal domain-containing protein [Gammaproteobacteria bacterium]
MNIDEAALRAHLGARLVEEDVATRAPLVDIVTTFDRPEPAPGPGEAVPPAWHQAYFHNTWRPASLGADGMPLETGVLPPLPLPRRMFAGMRQTYHQPIRVGDALSRETELTALSVRSGSTGTLVFTTQTRRISGPRGLAIVEEYDLVFREAVHAGTANPAPRREPAPAGLVWQREITVDPVMLFRFSAITFNPHRIHYDRTYAMTEEGYPGLVVHGPFLLQLLNDYARDCRPGRRLVHFDMKAKAPLFDVAPFTLAARPAAADAEVELWALTPEGTVAMQAVARFEG